MTTGPLALPPLQEIEAPATWQRVDFLSDLHLHAGLPRTLDTFGRHLRTTTADAVIILGDLFEVWVGDDAAAGDFEQACAAILADAARTRWVGFMPGNRDFLVGDAFLNACGVHRLHDPCCLRFLGMRVLLTHGDALCLDDREYQQFRLQVRAPQWQDAFLQRPLAQRRELAQQMRAASDERKRTLGPESYADVDEPSVRAWLQGARSSLMIHGHTHQPATHSVGDTGRREVLSDWDLDGDADAHPHRAEVLRLDAQGTTRLALTAGA